MKTKRGFTLIELVVACTILMILSTVATTATDSFIQAFKQLQTTNQTITYKNQVWSLKFTLAQAELNYAYAIANGTATGVVNDPKAISNWNQSVDASDFADLIPTLTPSFAQMQMPNITDLTSLLQRVGMYDPNGTNNPTIQLTSLTTTSTGTPTLTALPTVSWQGITL